MKRLLFILPLFISTFSFALAFDERPKIGISDKSIVKWQDLDREKTVMRFCKNEDCSDFVDNNIQSVSDDGIIYFPEHRQYEDFYCYPPGPDCKKEWLNYKFILRFKDGKVYYSETLFKDRLGATYKFTIGKRGVVETYEPGASLLFFALQNDWSEEKKQDYKDYNQAYDDCFLGITPQKKFLSRLIAQKRIFSTDTCALVGAVKDCYSGIPVDTKILERLIKDKYVSSDTKCVMPQEQPGRKIVNYEVHRGLSMEMKAFEEDCKKRMFFASLSTGATRIGREDDTCTEAVKEFFINKYGDLSTGLSYYELPYVRK